MDNTRSRQLFSGVAPFHTSLRKNVIWAFSGNLVFSGCQWVVLSVLAKLTTPEVVGKYALALAVVAPLMMIANFNIGVMLVTDTNRQFRFADYQTARLSLIALSFVLMLAVVRISHFSIDVLLATVILGILQAVDCYSDLYFSLMQRCERMARIAVSLILRGLLSLGVGAAVLYRTKDLLWTLAAMAGGRLVVLLAYDLWVCNESRVSDGTLISNELADCGDRARATSIQAAFHIVKTALPLTIVTFLTVLGVNIPRYFIERYAGHRDLGIFAAMWSLLTAGNMIAIAVGQALFPRLSKMYAARDLDGFRRLVWRSVQISIGLGFMGTAGSVIAGKQALQFIYRPEYAERHWLFTALMFTGTLLYVITALGYAATSARSFKSQAVLMCVVASTMLVGSALLVPRFGLWGAILAVAIGSGLHIAGLWMILNTVWGPNHAIEVQQSMAGESA
jgi:O-antigen/teichoic acid export membrane protein